MPTTRLRAAILDDGRPAYMIAALAGIPPTRISEYSLGRRSIPLKHVVALSDVLECEPGDITGSYEDEIEGSYG